MVIYRTRGACPCALRPDLGSQGRYHLPHATSLCRGPIEAPWLAGAGPGQRVPWRAKGALVEAIYSHYSHCIALNKLTIYTYPVEYDLIVYVICRSYS